MMLFISENLVIVKTTAAFPEYWVTLPEPRYLLKHSNNFLSLSCWVTLNLPFLFSTRKIKKVTRRGDNLSTSGYNKVVSTGRQVLCTSYLRVNCILYPIGFDGRSEILTSKLPSPDTKPETQLGSGISSVLITGLSTGVKSLNSDFQKSDKPKFIEAFILIPLIFVRTEGPSKIRSSAAPYARLISKANKTC